MPQEPKAGRPADKPADIDEKIADYAEDMIEGNASTELSSNRTAMSFERTGMSADRTLMSIIRTSLSLIGFGFTIFQFFHTLSSSFIDGGLSATAPRRFGIALLSLGVLLLVLGIFDHIRSTLKLRERRRRLYELKIIHHVAPLNVSTAMFVAVALLIVGMLAISSVSLQIGPF